MPRLPLSAVGVWCRFPDPDLIYVLLRSLLLVRVARIFLMRERNDGVLVTACCSFRVDSGGEAHECGVSRHEWRDAAQ